MQITIYYGDKSLGSYFLEKFRKGTISFGRQSDNDIVLNYDFVSCVHGVFYIDNGKWYVEDLNSSNGLRINGRLVHRQQISNDTITISRQGDNSWIKIIVQEKKSSDNMVGFALIVGSIAIVFVLGFIIAMVVYANQQNDKRTTSTMMDTTTETEQEVTTTEQTTEENTTTEQTTEENTTTEQITEENTTTEQTTTEAVIISKDLSVYFGTNIYDFVNIMGDMHDEHCSDGTIGYRNDAVIVETQPEDVIIHFISISDPCDYNIYDVQYGMTFEEARNRILPISMQIIRENIEGRCDYYLNNGLYLSLYVEDGLVTDISLCSEH